MISVVIPLYNKSGFVADALRSVLAQKWLPQEVIVVDDGSTDDGAEVVEAMGLDNIKLIRQRNSGVSAARNRGVAESKSDWIAFLDADDSWDADHLLNLVRLLKQHPDAVLIGAAYREHWLTRKGREVRFLRFYEGPLTDYFHASAYNPVFFTSSVMVARSAIVHVGGFKLGVSHGEDLDAWARLALLRAPIYTAKVTVNYMQGVPGQATALRKMSRPPILDTLIQQLSSGVGSHACLASIRYYLSINLPLYLAYGRISDSEFMELVSELKLAPFNFPSCVWRVFRAGRMLKGAVGLFLALRFRLLKRIKWARLVLVNDLQALKV